MGLLTRLCFRRNRIRRLRAAFSLLVILPTIPSQGGSNPPISELSLREFIQLVLERNDSVQTRLLEFEISRKKYRAEQGVFEPEFVLGYDYVENKRQNTAEQQRSLGVTLFEEHNNIYNGGLEA